ncbi:methylthioribulose 1-phosphate dehydratase [Paenibacillus antri]|uniref:Methylthioribulose-1-phosphate dehydratase n=1 Tax=Paenibacillus antri TaxID=2582848 RepID=A0A5R9GG63_9BACL|nr:methylthioribulose 1-phosphate dehydratase [Paenibacillus antri]TLS53140.1 methylthioribulose 1-phosphate dehydratase [Paenibacillus antri]
MNLPLEQRMAAFAELRAVKTDFAARGWFPGTSGNLSVRVGEYSPERFAFAVTASGKDKAANTPEDFLIVDQEGLPTEPTRLKPSAETLIHCEIYKHTGCGAIFHVHTIYNNIISEYDASLGAVPIEGVELIKAFNIWEENASIEVPILPNYAKIPRIAELVAGAIRPGIPGILLRNHGIYAWGANAFEAKRHLEAFEFLFEHRYKYLLLTK